MDDDEDEEEFGGMFENGHWIWDELTQALVFVSDLPPEEVEVAVVPLKAPTGTIDFRDNVDLIEQIRFRRRYLRKTAPGAPDVVTVQDVKDIALFTAPVTIQSVQLINMLHTVTCERFLRALLLYIQFYLQTADIMTSRMEELESKLRTPQCQVKENLYRDDLTDLRVLVAKEYGIMLIGGSDVRKFHHMGPAKKRRSLTELDARLIETLLRMCVQIIWLALARKNFSKIELEIHRLFKSEKFNMVEHTLKTDYYGGMAPPEKATLLGRCNSMQRKLNTRSPMMRDVFCHDVDYRLAALGVVKTDGTNDRLDYLELLMSAPEEMFAHHGLSLGIVGLERSKFDTMLNEIRFTAKGDEKSKMSVGSSLQSSRTLSSPSRSSAGGGFRRGTSVRLLYPLIELPPKEKLVSLPQRFPSFPVLALPARSRSVADEQRKKWLVRFQRLMDVRGKGHASSQG